MINILLSNKSLSILALFAATWWVFGPKINLIAVPGYEQGIRLEDMLFAVLFGILSFTTLSRRGNIEILGGKHGFSLILFMFASVLCSIIIFNSNPTTFIFSIRWLEYLLMGSILFQVAIVHWKKWLFLFKIYIFLNACIAPFSALDSVRYSGLSAGPWEVSSVVLFAFISIKPYLKSHKELYFYAICVLVIILAAQARVQLLAYILLLVLYKETRYKLAGITLPIIIFLFIFGALDDLLKMIRFESIGISPMLEIFEAIKQNGRSSEFYEMRNNLPDTDASSLARLLIWLGFIYKWLDFGIYGIMFGIGPGVGGVVVDGLYIRILTEFGLVGTLTFYLFLKKISSRLNKEHQIQLFLVIGIISLTNDPITSQRIFSAICLSLGLLFVCKDERIMKKNKRLEFSNAKFSRVIVL